MLENNLDAESVDKLYSLMEQLEGRQIRARPGEGPPGVGATGSRTVSRTQNPVRPVQERGRQITRTEVEEEEEEEEEEDLLLPAPQFPGQH